MGLDFATLCVTEAYNGLYGIQGHSGHIFHLVIDPGQSRVIARRGSEASQDEEDGAKVRALGGGDFNAPLTNAR